MADGHGGARRGSGRKKNRSPRTKKAKALIDKLVNEGYQLPLEYLLEVMRDPDSDRAERFAAATAAAPYVHPKLSSIVHTPKHLDLSRLSDEQLRQFEQLVKAATPNPGGHDRANGGDVPNRVEPPPGVGQPGGKPTLN